MGKMTRKIISVPWIVKSSLYPCAPMSCCPGRASSVRMRSAKIPPTAKNEKELTR
jgi:hypothetical protein